MKRREADLDAILDQALNEIRDETPDSRFVAEATEQVWKQLATHEPALSSTTALTTGVEPAPAGSSPPRHASIASPDSGCSLGGPVQIRP